MSNRIPAQRSKIQRIAPQKPLVLTLTSRESETLLAAVQRIIRASEPPIPPSEGPEKAKSPRC